VLIRPGAHVPAVFLVHDGFGETLVYRNLAMRLDAGVAVYGLAPVASADAAMPHTRIEEIAAAYVASLRRVQAHGPYLLGGLCAGGVIAFEMARQLQRDGERIGMLALMDANDARAPRRIGRYAIDRIRDYSGTLKRGLSLADPIGAAAALLAFIAGVGRLLSEQVAVRAASVPARLRARLLRYCLDRGRRPPAFLRGLSVDQIYAYAESVYEVHGQIDGDVLLVRASEGNGDFGDEPYRNLFNDPLLGWGRRVRGQVLCADVGGGHYSMFQEPHVQALADRLQPHIDAARQAAQPQAAG
jgi:thioesterase domain-containing protein